MRKNTAPTFEVDFPLVQLPSNAAIDGPEPTPDFLRSLDFFKGNFTPLIVQRMGARSKKCKIVAGRRRVKGLRELGYEFASAWCYPASWDEGAILALHENECRSDNLVVAYQNIREYAGEESDPDTLSELLCIPKARIKRILTLDKLHPVLLEALARGKMRDSIALKVSKYDAAQQHALIEILEEKDRITIKDAHSVNSVGVAALAEDLPDEIFEEIGQLFNPPEPEPEPEPEPMGLMDGLFDLPAPTPEPTPAAVPAADSSYTEIAIHLRSFVVQNPEAETTILKLADFLGVRL